ncbi:MAG: CrcB family protein [Acidimicrobiia bacterium]|nr:CrcB family protein [Acidimicrobiia bacterium]
MTVVAVMAAMLAAAGVGTIVRFLTSLLFNDQFPVGTLAVNLLASTLLGLLVGADVGDSMSLIVGTGALGALSTWSAAANEAAIMARRGEGYLALAYLALTVLSGVTFAWFGLQLGQAL